MARWLDSEASEGFAVYPRLVLERMEAPGAVERLHNDPHTLATLLDLGYLECLKKLTPVLRSNSSQPRGFPPKQPKWEFNPVTH